MCRIAAGSGVRDALAAARLAIASVTAEQQKHSRGTPAEHGSHLAPLYMLQASLLETAQRKGTSEVCSSQFPPGWLVREQDQTTSFVNPRCKSGYLHRGCKQWSGAHHQHHVMHRLDA